MYLPETQNAWLWAGKKNEVILPQASDVNIAERSARQLFAKVPGVFVYDMDGAGNQINISTRGLDPHRGWEFNIRANGVITNSDMFGYPASHFSVPMEAIERIELVRGAGSLQYGAQFGGMLNYVLREPDTSRVLGAEIIASAGAFGMFSHYVGLSGGKGRWRYGAYTNRRSSKGYRESSASDFDAQGLQVHYHAGKGLRLQASLGRSCYRTQLPGPLNDSLFQADPRQATRNRNYYSPEIYVPAFKAEWQPNQQTFVSFVSSAVLGSRNSVLFDRPATVADLIDPITLQYAPRQVDIDRFNSYTQELRVLHHYRIGRMRASVSAGAQYLNNDLHRRQQGKGSTGSDYDLSLTNPLWGRDMHLKSQHVALFLENKFQILPDIAISPGIRYERGRSDLSGKIVYYPENELPNTIRRNFILPGLNVAWTPRDNLSLYGGLSYAYRPVVFKDIIPASVYESVDKNLKDAYGYNADLGFKGYGKKFRWDVSIFRMLYQNRMGNLAQTAPDGSLIIYRTNIGDALTHGVEAFGEYTWYIGQNSTLQLFNATAWMHAVYAEGTLRNGQENQDIRGNRVEGVPAWISRTGLNYQYRNWSITVLGSYTHESFADAFNTEKPNASGSTGLTSAYHVLDLNMTWRPSDLLHIRLNISNIGDQSYFTKRPTFYPGPGIWPSDGRSWNVTLGIKL